MAAFFGSILFFFLFIILFVLILGFSLLARLVGGVRNLFNIFRGKGFNANNIRNSTYYTEDDEQQAASDNQGDRPHSKGVFSDDEGTYVDFEEIKE